MMGIVGMVGTGLYYAGFLVMVISLLLLIGSVSQELGNVMGQVKTASAKPSLAAPCAGGTCAAASSPQAYDNAFDMALYPADVVLGGWADWAMARFGVANLQNDPSVPGSFYAQVKRFLIHLAVGMAILTLGLLLKATDGFVGMLDGRGQKQRSERTRERLGVMARKENE